MAYLSAVSSLDSVVQWEVNDAGQTTGGAGGGANAQAQALLNRLKYYVDGAYQSIIASVGTVLNNGTKAPILTTAATAINTAGVAATAATGVIPIGGTGGLLAQAFICTVGTWTPTIIGTSTAGSQTYTAQYGTYIKIGGYVFCNARIALSAKDAATAGNLVIGGLPFQVTNVDANYRSAGPIQSAYITFSTGYSVLGTLLIANETRAYLYQSGSGVDGLALPVAGLANNSWLALNMFYKTV